MIYAPQEDSYLLQKYVKKFAQGFVLDLGTGSGIQALTAAKKKSVKKVFAVDIDKEAIDYCKKIIAKSKFKAKIKFFLSDLFSRVRKGLKFDTIIFNPPYLPGDHKVQNIAIEGGKKGYELLQRFLNDLNRWLKPKGIALIVFSSLTGKTQIDKTIEENLLSSKLLEELKLPWERLYAYKIKKSNELLKLERKGIKNIKFLAKGKRGLVFLGDWRGRKVAIKVKRKASLAIKRIENEAKMLKALNRFGIGPRFLFSNKRFCGYAFVAGEFILDWLKKQNKQNVKKILIEILNQCFKLDQLKINKEELHRPFKHIIIDEKGKATLIDFERAHKTKKPHNLTQFIDFILGISKILEEKEIKINSKELIEFAKNYKQNINQENFNNILSALNQY